MPIDNQQANLVWEKMAKIKAAEVAISETAQQPQTLVVNDAIKAVRLKFTIATSNKASTGG